MVKKRTSKRRAVTISRDAETLNKILVENFVSLQKAVTNLSLKFEALTDNITKLLQLFEISARSFSEKLSAGVPEIEKDREFLDKLNKLLEQNKVIAKGLTLMEEKIRERVYGPTSSTPVFPTRIPPRQTFPAYPTYQAPSYPTPQEEGYIPSSLEKKKEEE